MKLRKTHHYLLIYFTAILLSCTTTTTKIKNPEFSDQAKVQNELSSLVKAENINLSGKEIIINKKSSSELEVSIINGQNIPSDNDKQKAFEKLIAVCIKKNLKNPNEFESYKILIVKKTENNGVKNQSWTGNTFKASDL
jgi:low affinity Fe/Cu permease